VNQDLQIAYGQQAKLNAISVLKAIIGILLRKPAKLQSQTVLSDRAKLLV
jgi:hypothetical protein